MFEELDDVRVAVIGDFCLDVYWYADMTKSRLSRETAHYPLPVKREVVSPGGAGNVACNLQALSPRSVVALGVIGADWRGDVLRRLIEERGIENRLITAEDRFTNTYIKPMRFGYSGEATEDARLDFEADTSLNAESEDRLIEALDSLKAQGYTLCVCDQMEYGCITPRVREKIVELGRNGMQVFADSRERIGCFEYVTVKPNELEAANATGEKDPSKAARKLEEATHRPAIVTCGEKGCVLSENGIVTVIPAFKLPGETDICGAGDTFLSALAAFSAAGRSLKDAARIASAASCVTVHKLHQTGTANREELRKITE